jgi:hypothetical protein
MKIEYKDKLDPKISAIMNAGMTVKKNKKKLIPPKSVVDSR